MLAAHGCERASFSLLNVPKADSFVSLRCKRSPVRREREPTVKLSFNLEFTNRLGGFGVPHANWFVEPAGGHNERSVRAEAHTFDSPPVLPPLAYRQSVGIDQRQETALAANDQRCCVG